jgi:hypothetical protein
MPHPLPRLCLAVFIFLALAAVACDGDDESTSSPTASAASTATPSDSPSPEPSAAPPPAVDPCTLRDSLEGQPLTPGPAFTLNDDVAWQLCIGGAAAGSSEKYLYMTSVGGAGWTLLAMTTLGNPPPEPNVGELPNGNAAEVLFFIDEQDGWLGLSSPGENLHRSEDGGKTWTAVDALPPGLPVTDVEFSDAENGTLITPEGDWTTSDGGDTWSPAP